MIKHILVCTKGHETPTTPVEYGHVIECPICHEIAIKVYPQNGGREWVIIPEETAKFHMLTTRLQNDE